MKDLSVLAFGAYKKNLSGLPSFCRLVMLELFEYCDHAAGTISINSLDKLARDSFYVDPLRGRVQENITGDTIRNAFRKNRRTQREPQVRIEKNRVKNSLAGLSWFVSLLVDCC